MPNEKMKKCPKCGEEILASAKTCKHCHSDLRNWFMRHKLITIFIIFPIALTMIVSALSDLDESKKGNDTTQVSVTNTQTQSEVKKEPRVITEVEISSSKITKDSIGTPILNVYFNNKTDKTVDGIDIEAYFLNNFDEPVGQFGAKKEEAFDGSIQEKIKPQGTFGSEWNLAVYEHTTKIKSVRITRVHFTDGTMIEAD
jgi:hypothetical protein